MTESLEAIYASLMSEVDARMSEADARASSYQEQEQTFDELLRLMRQNTQRASEMLVECRALQENGDLVGTRALLAKIDRSSRAYEVLEAELNRVKSAMRAIPDSDQQIAIGGETCRMFLKELKQCQGAEKDQLERILVSCLKATAKDLAADNPASAHYVETLDRLYPAQSK